MPELNIEALRARREKVYAEETNAAAILAWPSSSSAAFEEAEARYGAAHLLHRQQCDRLRRQLAAGANSLIGYHAGVLELELRVDQSGIGPELSRLRAPENVPQRKTRWRRPTKLRH